MGGRICIDLYYKNATLFLTMIDKNQKCIYIKVSFVNTIIHAFNLYYYSCVSYHINYALHKNDISMISQTTDNKLSKDRKCSTFGIIASFFSFVLFYSFRMPKVVDPEIMLIMYTSCLFCFWRFLIFNISLSELRILDLRHEKISHTISCFYSNRVTSSGYNIFLVWL